MSDDKDKEGKFVGFLGNFLGSMSYVSVILLAVVSAVVLLIILYLFIACQINRYKYNDFRKTKPFDSSVWKEIDPHEGEFDDPKRYLRCNMYRDLVKNHLHFGMSYEEVVKLVGEPEFVDYYANPESKKASYNIGECTIVCLSIATNVKGYRLFLDFDRNAGLVAFGHNDDQSKKGGVKLWKRHRLFYCGNEGLCRRYIKIPGDALGGIEKCQRSEVESKWGYKVW